MDPTYERKTAMIYNLIEENKLASAPIVLASNAHKTQNLGNLAEKFLMEK